MATCCLLSRSVLKRVPDGPVTTRKNTPRRVSSPAKKHGGERGEIRHTAGRDSDIQSKGSWRGAGLARDFCLHSPKGRLRAWSVCIAFRGVFTARQGGRLVQRESVRGVRHDCTGLRGQGCTRSREEGKIPADHSSDSLARLRCKVELLVFSLNPTLRRSVAPSCSPWSVRLYKGNWRARYARKRIIEGGAWPGTENRSPRFETREGERERREVGGGGVRRLRKNDVATEHADHGVYGYPHHVPSSSMIRPRTLSLLKGIVWSNVI
ncbi:hypothetical protein DB88DRAFT_484709 [Papiliotrema laurentii]|uniref:Uncharacterized protein n=1 Tax=Papiliotrema laurentii TaxID=5418 RepID=A0AAD9FT62_PAPLA|nr:hypothetical protein DB88DRAFT_484709 [Papiliotrema laurentii]